MAERGAPLGNNNAAKAKRWESAIIRAFEAWPNPPDSEGCNGLMRGLNDAAHNFVSELMTKKDIGFFRELGDRMDGKAPQAITGADGGPFAISIVDALKEARGRLESDADK